MSEATGPSRSAEASTAEYFRCMIEKDVDGIFALFAPDAVWADFRGAVLRGNAVIRDHYANRVFTSDRRLNPRPAPVIAAGNRSAVEIDSGENLVVDVFDFDDQGRVTCLRIYRREPAPDAPPIG
jgi:ketosteroid isomerase-like protein